MSIAVMVERNVTLADLIEAYCSATGRSRRELSRRAGLNHAMIGRWERGELSDKPVVGNVDKLAEELEKELGVDRDQVRHAAGIYWGVPPGSDEERVLQLFRRLSPQQRRLWMAQGEDIERHWE